MASKPNVYSDMQAHDKAYAQHPDRKGSKPPVQQPFKNPDITIGAAASLPTKVETDKMRQQNPETPLNDASRTGETI